MDNLLKTFIVNVIAFATSIAVTAICLALITYT